MARLARARKRPAVYVVVDDAAVRDSLKILLETHGFRVIDFASPHDLLRRRRPLTGCLVLDQHLGGASGLDFLASPEGAALGLPAILTTGRGDPALVARAQAMGVPCFEKPVAADRLFAAINAALGRADT
jgi:FixJ family two-component response regulator